MSGDEEAVNKKERYNTKTINKKHDGVKVIFKKKKSFKGSDGKEKSDKFAKGSRRIDKFRKKSDKDKSDFRDKKVKSKDSNNVNIRRKCALIKKKNMETKITYAAEQTSRSEFLLMEEKGYIEADETEDTSKLTQHELAAAVDITSANKFFDLKLVQFGPYSIDYTRNGRHLVIGGRKGHLAAIDWMTKKLKCEINVMEEIQSVKWLHQETMFAAAQKEWVFIYDNQGTELHCIKSLFRILRMEFLPYHFILATSSEKGYLSWLDVSVGSMVAQFQSRMGRLDVMCQNPYNATLALGHSQGVVSVWSPNVREPLLKMLCHKHAIKAVAIDKTGQYMATAAIDRSLKIWDMRNTHKCVKDYVLGGGASRLTFSQTDYLATSIGNIVEIYSDPCRQTVTKPFIRHTDKESISSIKFCPYEDVMGIGHSGGFTSIIVPGAGEANFDALEANPYQTKTQRKEAEVKALLEKIQPELICLDPSKINRIDVVTMKEKFEAEAKSLVAKAPKTNFVPRHKTKGKSSSKKVIQKKQGIREATKRVFIKQQHKQQKKTPETTTENNSDLLTNRFKKKT